MRLKKTKMVLIWEHLPKKKSYVNYFVALVFILGQNTKFTSLFQTVSPLKAKAIDPHDVLLF